MTLQSKAAGDLKETPPSAANVRDDEALAQWRATIKELIETEPESFAKMVCRGVLAEPGSQGAWIKDQRDGYRRAYGAVARMTLDALEGINQPSQQGDVVSLSEWITSDFGGGRQRIDFLYYGHYKDARTSHELIYTFFSPLIDGLSHSIALATQHIFHGVPVYEMQDSQYVLVEDDAEIVAYLRQRGSRYDLVSSSHIPDWADQLHFKRTHLKTHDLFFPATDREPSLEEVAQLRTAYRHAIGEPLSSSNARRPGSSSSKLLSLVDEVLSRYYGINFLVADANTWPRQKDVVAWLREMHGLSEREAQAVDIVCRPDSLRGK